jgi:nucleotide-binding universal stress UspA family protein
MRSQHNKLALTGNPEQSTVSNALQKQIGSSTIIGTYMNELLTKTRATQTTSSGADLRIKKILVAVDLSTHSEKTAAYAVELAAPFGASVTLFHVCSPKQATEETSSKDSRFGEPLIEPEQALGDLLKKIRQKYSECSGYVCVGDPADKIVMMAETLRADLIVTGSRNLSFLGRLLGFDEPSRIVHRAPCPVLVYHDSN